MSLMKIIDCIIMKCVRVCSRWHLPHGKFLLVCIQSVSETGHRYESIYTIDEC